MIKNCNDATLRAKNIDDKYILLYQVWKELTEPKTLDSYQYRVMNTLSGIRELSLVIAQRINSFTNTNHNIDDCKSELKKILSQDQTMKVHYPVIWQRLMSHLGEKTESVSQQKVLRYQLDYCYSAIRDNYFAFLLDDLQSDIDNALNDQIISKAGQLISCCVTQGWSTQALNSLVNILNNSKNDASKWNAFKNRILSSSSDTYTIYIPIKVNPKPSAHISKNVLRDNFHNQLRDMGASIKSAEEMRSMVAGLDATSDHVESRYYMSFSVTALDFYAASHIAIGRCSDSMSLLSFFNFIEAWDISELKWLVINNDTSHYKWIKYGDLYGTYDYLEGAYKLINAAKNIVARDSSIQRKLRAAFSYSNMGKASSTQEEKFINTWVALESLCRGDVYENIISNVLETVPPALCARYIYQLFRNFIEDCTRCEVDFMFTFGQLWDARATKEECVKAIIETFNDSSKYAELEAKCSINSLLLCRCKQLYTLATDHNKFINKIEQHHQNVRLQLSRLVQAPQRILCKRFSTKSRISRFQCA